MLIAKAPKLYGFFELKLQAPYSYDYFHVPAGTDLYSLATYLRVDSSLLTRLNPELVKGFIPPGAGGHTIRVPKGYLSKVSQFVRAQL